jgi:hypothetical protein
MMPKELAPDAIRGGCRFSENIMRKHKAKTNATSFEVISPWPFLTPETAAP